MIINTLEGDIEVVGDVKEFKTSIDPENLEFITTLLSSNLYSDPEQSFIREIVSNAWDSHVEAGNTDVPVVIQFKRYTSVYDITIRDYGTGLSPERFNEVYRNIGSSTKRLSNKYIGAFGIGHLSPFACSNSVYITSYYNGMAYYYVGSKSNNTITYHQLMEKPTTEKNGVEVTIKNISNIKPYEEALSCVTFFPNVYIDGINNNINDVKIKKFNNFAAAAAVLKQRLLLGNVLYKVDKSLLSSTAREFLDKLNQTGIVIKFNIGELSITPNRESIIYNSDTIALIEDRIAEAKKELFTMMEGALKEDFDNLIFYYKALHSPVIYDPVENKKKNLYDIGYKLRVSDLNLSSLTFKGLDLHSYDAVICNIINCTLPNCRGVIIGNKICNKNIPYGNSDKIKCDKVLILNKGARLTEIAKRYIKNHYQDYAIITEITYSEFIDYLKEQFRGSVIFDWNDNTNNLIFQEAYNYIIAHSVNLDLNNDKDFLAYKDELKKERSITSIPLKEAILYIWNNHGWKDKHSFRTLAGAIKYIKGLKKGVILSNLDAPVDIYRALAELKGFVYIQARKDIVSDINKLGLSCLVDAKWLMTKDPLLSKVKAAKSVFNEGFEWNSFRGVRKNVSEEDSTEFTEISKLLGYYGSSAIYKNIVDSSDIPCDEYTKYISIKLKTLMDKYSKAREIVLNSGLSDDVLVTATVMKTKAYRISGKAYMNLQNNKFLRILCRK